MRRARPGPIVVPLIAPTMRMRRSTRSSLEYRRVRHGHSSAGPQMIPRSAPIRRESSISGPGSRHGSTTGPGERITAAGSASGTNASGRHAA
jgi:hypothetical protein